MIREEKRREKHFHSFFSPSTSHQHKQHTSTPTTHHTPSPSVHFDCTNTQQTLPSTRGTRLGGEGGGSGMGQSPSTIKQIRPLRKPKENVETRDARGWTPLMRACWDGDLKKVQRALENGALIDSRDNEGRTPLMIATERGHLSIITLLLSERKKLSSDSPSPDQTSSFSLSLSPIASPLSSSSSSSSQPPDQTKIAAVKGLSFPLLPLSLNRSRLSFSLSCFSAFILPSISLAFSITNHPTLPSINPFL